MSQPQYKILGGENPTPKMGRGILGGSLTPKLRGFGNKFFHVCYFSKRSLHPTFLGGPPPSFLGLFRASFCRRGESPPKTGRVCPSLGGVLGGEFGGSPPQTSPSWNLGGAPPTHLLFPFPSLCLKDNILDFGGLQSCPRCK